MSEAKKTDRKYEVALSYAGEDRAYVEKVAAELSRLGISLFYDRYEEADLWGKNLYDHLRHIYAEASDYTVIFASEAYAKKVWTNHERESAQSRALEEKREYILPARFDDTLVPGLAKSIAYIDLQDRSPESFAQLIAKKIGRSLDTSSIMTKEELQKQPIYAAVFNELASTQKVSHALLDAISTKPTALEGLAEFLLLIVKEAEGFTRLGIAIFVITCLKKFNIGYEAIDFCLSENQLDEGQRKMLGNSISTIDSPDRLLKWAHERLTIDIKNDVVYHVFLEKNIDFITTHLADEMTVYLIFPDRGPGNYNTDTFYRVIRHLPHAGAFIERWINWINDGRFDGQKEKGDMAASILYQILNEVIEAEDSKFDVIIERILQRITSFQKNPEDVSKGLYHLLSMLSADFRGTDYILLHLFPRIYVNNNSPEQLKLFYQIRIAFKTLLQLNEQADNQQLKETYEQQKTDILLNSKIAGY